MNRNIHLDTHSLSSMTVNKVYQNSANSLIFHQYLRHVRYYRSWTAIDFFPSPVLVHPFNNNSHRHKSSTDRLFSNSTRLSDVLNTACIMKLNITKMHLLLFYVGTYAQRRQLFFNTYKHIFSFVYKNKIYKSKYDAFYTFM